ncbi:hypothetical protein PZA11_000725 [Diplocarpon coronariae]
MDSASTSSSGNRLFGDTKTENTSKQTTENAGLVISAGDKKPSRTKAKDQLARKRAADRNAQQSMRQRTRDHIHDLEARFKELKRQQALLEVAEKRTGKLETELEELKEELGKLRRESGRLCWFFAIVLTPYFFSSWEDIQCQVFVLVLPSY